MENKLAKGELLKNKQSAIKALNACDEFVIFTRIKGHNYTQCISSIQSVSSFNEIYYTMKAFVEKIGDVK